MKNVVKAVRKDGQGKVKDEGKVWFTQLQDKHTLFWLLCVVFLFLFCVQSAVVNASLLLHEELWWIT